MLPFARALMLSAATLALTCSIASAAGVRAARHDGFTRLVFDLKSADAFVAAVEGHSLVIRFNQPLPAEIDGAAFKRLEGLATRLDISGDRKIATIELLKPVTVRAFPNDQSAVIDLMDAPAWPAADTAPVQSSTQPQATAPTPTVAPVAVAPSAGAQTVPVRVGAHDDFVRFVFEWDSAVQYKLTNDGGRATISFDRPARINQAATEAALPKAIGGFAVGPDGAGTSVAMRVPADAKLRDFRNGNKVVVDVMTAPNAAPVSALAGQTVATVDTQPVTPATSATPVSVPPTASSTTANPVAASPATASPAAAGAVTAPLAITPRAAASVAPQRPTTPQAAQTPAIAPAAQAVATAPSEAAPRPLVVAAVATAAPPAASVTVGASTAAGATILRFPWQPVPALAVFVRGGWLYVVSDQWATFDFAAVRRMGDKIGKPEQLATADGAAARFAVPANTIVQTTRDDKGWTISLRQGARKPELSAAVHAEPNGPAGPQVVIDLEGANAVVAVPDPDLGDTLRVIPSLAAGKGVDTDRKFAQFDVLASFQGVVVAPKADAVVVGANDGHVAVGMTTGLALSRLASAKGKRVFDFEPWTRPDMNWAATRDNFNERVSLADPAQRPAIDVEFGQFYLATGFPSDAAGMFDLAGQTDPALANDPGVKALLGASKLMQGLGDEAASLFADPRFDNDPEALLWRAAAVGQNGDWKASNDLFHRAPGIPESYPLPLRAELAMLSAQAAIENNEPARAKPLFDIVARPDVAESVRGRGEYLRARMLLANNGRDLGMMVLDRLVTGKDSWERAHAIPIWIDAKMSMGQMTTDQAIDQLERMRLSWSGDDAEYIALRKLGDLYFAKGDVRTGLRRLREAINYFPDRTDGDEVRNRMSDMFVSIYNEPSPQVAPLEALALFDDYRDLTPPGDRGDVMIQNLADRLVAVDLLDRAAELLDHQIQFRLKGVDKARVGARLAVVNLLDRKPDAALVGLDSSEAPNIPADLATERRMLRARALTAKGDAPGALALLDVDKSLEATRLRAEIFAKSGDWAKAATTLNELLGDRKVVSLDDRQQGTVVKLAIAYTLAGDGGALRSLRDDMKGLMKSSTLKPTFDLLTSGSQTSRGVDAVALTMKFGEVSEFQSALSTYRDKMKEGGLSSIN